MGVLVSWALGFALLTAGVTVAWSMLVDPAAKALPSALAGLGGSPGLLGAVVFFVAVYLLAHAALGAGWAWVTRPLVAVLSADQRRARRLMLLSFLPLLLALLLANALSYPESLFAYDGVPPALLGALGVLLWSIVAYAAIVIVTGTAMRLRAPAARAVVAAAVAGFVLVVLLGDARPTAPASHDRTQADIILIGVDGLRPDHIDPVLMPALYARVADALRIEHAWTPLARTFPAWVSILTGQYPGTHGAHFNLTARELVDDHGSLAHQLGEAGYQRIYAIDETRFSNLDAGFGFDQVVAPAMGGFDFILSAVGDLPMVNILAGTRAGRWLFPYAHMNRALDISYRPEVFDNALARSVRALDRSQPVFLVAHFELPHWPYGWADARGFEFDDAPHLGHLSTRPYRRSLARVDRQVAALLESLERAGRLRNAVLVLLSDHGEAFRGLEPRWHAATSDAALDVGAGHGTHVLSAAQNGVLLAFAGYGRAGEGLVTGVNEDATASLVDVRPTLHDWLGLAPPPAPVDGESLWPLLRGAAFARSHPVILETGFSPPSVAVGEPDVAVLVAESARYYDVGRDGRLTLKRELMPGLRASKQRAAVAGPWVLAALPRDDGDQAADLLIAHSELLAFWPIDSPQVPESAPVAMLADALCRHYRGDPIFSPRHCRSGAWAR